MSDLSRNDIKTLALCLYNDPTLHDSDHDKIRSLITHLPNHLRDPKFTSIITEPRHAAKPCLVHAGIASLVVSSLFTSLQKQVDESVPLLKERYGLCFGPEEIYLLERMTIIEGMWSPPTARTGPTKMRYWDYQVNKCQACMISRVAADSSALRDMRTLLLATIDSSTKTPESRLLPNHPTLLSFINEWISLNSRSDELFYFSGIQAGSIKAVKERVEEPLAATPRCHGNKNFSYPSAPYTAHTSSGSSFQSTGIFTPTRTPGGSTSSKVSSTFEWPALATRYPISDSESTVITAPTRGREPGVSFPSQTSSSSSQWLPFQQQQQQQQAYPQDSFTYANTLPTNIHSTHSFSPHDGVKDNSFIERDTPAPRRPHGTNPEASQDRPNSLESTSTRSSHASFMSFIRREMPSASPPHPSPPPPPPLPRRRCMDLPRASKPDLHWEDSGVGIGYPTRDESTWTFLHDSSTTSDEAEQQQHQQGQGQTQPRKSAFTEASEQQQEDDETPLISRWSASSSIHPWSNLLKRTTRGPRLGKVKTGRAIFKPVTEKEGKKNKKA
ncbi:uncharacterized protein TRUGW13939_08734 [Talaromyces rugulosus]|uniref:Uncharacterized protein n=1 Tax=Talaromyces rugulosus TaxID=121627 RepID=A0A7H8R5E9_TALRU|nr:uncharacterized protein TRUGW13939_08734 [Talaromyces rugulosus]QKX61582.1 hypothetical protein TRUGW13939_08734 [Talaromyces rugulosus]